MHCPQETENGVCILHAELIIVVIPELVRIELLGPLHHVEIDKGVFLVEYPSAIRQLLELLFDTELVHPVQVDVGGGVQQYFLDRIIAVERYVKPSRKPVAFAVCRDESQIHTFVSSHIERIHDVVMVVGGR